MIVIPYKPRPAFMPFHESDKRFSCMVIHRRAGKTVSCINQLLRGALTCDKPNPRFAYVAPTYSQAKDVAWEYLKHYAAPVLEKGGSIHESELRIDLPNGGRVRLYGAENYDRLRGLYLDGVVLDEFGTMDPRIWDVVRPALSDRKGWCVWIGTPNGHNAFYETWKKAVGEDEWFSLMLKASESGIIDPGELASARKDMTEEQFDREYECSFEAAIRGAYYATEFKRIDEEKRLTAVPWDSGIEVHTAWDLGIGDSTAIWFFQVAGREIHLIDYYETSGVGLDHYAKEIKSRPYVYGSHWFPHDVKVKELGTGKSREETLNALGIKVETVPNIGLDDGINSVRRMLNKCWFDKVKCGRGVEALRQYQRDFDEKLKAFKSKPLHNWASHGSDAFRYLSLIHDRAGTSPHKIPELGAKDYAWVA